jgi:hypothetical protein
MRVYLTFFFIVGFLNRIFYFLFFFLNFKKKMSLQKLALSAVEENPELYQELQVVAAPSIRKSALKRRASARIIQKAYNKHLTESSFGNRFLADYHKRSRKYKDSAIIYIPLDRRHAKPEINFEFSGPSSNTRLFTTGEGRPMSTKKRKLKSREVQRTLPYAHATNPKNWVGDRSVGRPLFAPPRKLTNFPSRRKTKTAVKKKKKCKKCKKCINSKRKRKKEY